MASFWKAIGKSTDTALVAVSSVATVVDVGNAHVAQWQKDAQRSLRIAASLADTTVGIAHTVLEKLEDNDAFKHLSADAKLQLLTSLVNEERTHLGKTEVTVEEVKSAFPDLYKPSPTKPASQQQPAATKSA